MRLDDIFTTGTLSPRAHAAMRVVDLDTGEVLYDRDGQKLFTPASNVKLYTSACALMMFGPDFRFTTSVGIEGFQSGDTLRGDLILRGGGDPSLTSADLAELAARVKNEMGISRIQGNIVVDASLFSPVLKGPGWMWDDDPDYYNMSIAPIMVDYNVLQVDVHSPKSGDPTVRMSPAASYPPLEVTLKDGAKTEAQIDRAPFAHTVTVSGTVAADDGATSRSLTMHDPATWAAAVFVEYLRSGVGVSVSGGTVVARQPTRVASVLEHESPPLIDMLTRFNKVSENAIGEMLFLDLAVLKDRVPAKWSDGAGIVTEWLTKTVGLSPDSFRLVDGSGLSRYNLISAEGTSALLVYMSRQPEFDAYRQTLPIAGVDGSLSNRMRGTAAAGNVYAKTGSMSGVSTLSGYVRRAGGGWVAFSILTNGLHGSVSNSREFQDDLCVAMAEWAGNEKPAGK